MSPVKYVRITEEKAVNNNNSNSNKSNNDNNNNNSNLIYIYLLCIQKLVHIAEWNELGVYMGVHTPRAYVYL